MSRGSSSVRTVGRFSGGLIQTSAAGVSGLGTPWTNRSGWRAWAAASTEARVSRAAVAWPVCTTAGVSRPIPEWQCSSLCQRKNPRQKSSPWKVTGEAVWEVGPVLQRLELALGEGVVVADMGSAVGLGHAKCG